MVWGQANGKALGTIETNPRNGKKQVVANKGGAKGWVDYVDPTTELTDADKAYLKALATAQTFDASDLPPAFDPAATYTAGAVVAHQGKIYTTSINQAAGAFDPVKWDDATEQKIGVAQFFPDKATADLYAATQQDVDDYRLFATADDNKLFKATAAGAGNLAEVSPSSVTTPSGTLVELQTGTEIADRLWSPKTLEDAFGNDDRIALPADSKPLKNQFHLIAGATTLDGTDVLAGGAESYYFDLPPNTALTVPGIIAPLTHAGPNNETVHLMPHPTNAGEFVRLNGNAKSTAEIDIRGLTSQTLTAGRRHLVNNTTTLDLTAGAEGDEASLWNDDTDTQTTYRHDGTSYKPDANDHEHEVLENIAVAVRSAGTNAGSAVQIDFFDIDGVAYPSTDWTVSTAPVTGLESYTAHGPIIVSDVPYTGSFAITHNKQGFLFFKYVGDNANGLSSVTYAGTNGANADGQIIVNFTGTNYHVDFENKAAVTATPFTKEAEPTSTAAKNALVYPVGSFTALPVNDSGTGADGAVYKLPTVDALQIVLPNKADMSAAEGVWRVRISGEWAGLSAQTTPMSFSDDTTNGVVFGDGLPASGNEWVDLVFDAAGDRWIATIGGDVTLTQVIPSYDEHAQVPAAIRLYLATGTGAAAEGLYRKQVSDNSPQLIG